MRLGLLVIIGASLTACAKSEAGDLSGSRISSALQDKGKAFPATLDDTSLFLDNQGKVPVTALTPYEVRVPLWSDGAHKQRYIFVPPNETVKVNPTTFELDFPVGTTLVKYFAAANPADASVETRVITKKDDGQWHFATYVWDAAKGSAALNKNPRKVPGPDGDYRIPSEAECKTCHANGTKPLGFTLAQVKDIEKLVETVKFDQPLEVLRAAPHLDDVGDEALPLMTRARTYMSVNCSPCHNPDGPDKANKMDFRLGVSEADTHVVSEGKLVPGDRANSILWQKISAQDKDRMPPVSLRADPTAVDLLGKAIDQWPTSPP
jgi:hypothetical protein